MFSNTSKMVLVALLTAFACAPEGDDRATVPTDVAGGANKEDPPRTSVPSASSPAPTEPGAGGSSGGGDENKGGTAAEQDGEATDMPEAGRVGDFAATCGNAGTAQDQTIGCRVSAKAGGPAADGRKIKYVYAVTAAGGATKLDVKVITGTAWSVSFVKPDGDVAYAVFHTDAEDKDLARDDYEP